MTVHHHCTYCSLPAACSVTLLCLLFVHADEPLSMNACADSSSCDNKRYGCVLWLRDSGDCVPQLLNVLNMRCNRTKRCGRQGTRPGEQPIDLDPSSL
jgi:hypothetical protein